MNQNFNLCEFDTSEKEVIYQFFLDLDARAAAFFLRKHFATNDKFQSVTIVNIMTQLNIFLYSENFIKDYIVSENQGTILCCISSNSIDKNKYLQLAQQLIIYCVENPNIQLDTENIKVFFEKDQLNNLLRITDKQQHFKI